MSLVVSPALTGFGVEVLPEAEAVEDWWAA
jgi:hypothetical protein